MHPTLADAAYAALHCDGRGSIDLDELADLIRAAPITADALAHSLAGDERFRVLEPPPALPCLENWSRAAHAAYLPALRLAGLAPVRLVVLIDPTAAPEPDDSPGSLLDRTLARLPDVLPAVGADTIARTRAALHGA